MSIDLLVLLGPTASGKTRLAVELARALDAEVISADSRQVYRGLDLGTGKDLDEYTEGGPPVPYHLIDIVDLDVEFNVFLYRQSFFAVLGELRERQRSAIMAGGSGLYLEAILEGYQMVEAPVDPNLRTELEELDDQALRHRLRGLRTVHNTTDLEDRDRLIRAIEVSEAAATREAEPAPAITPLVLGVRWDRSTLRRRIRERLAVRLKQGLIEEVEGLLARGVSWEKLHFLGLEYRFIADYLRGSIRNRNDLEQKLGSAICGLARKQASWFRRMERRGTQIVWIDGGDPDRALREIEEQGGLLPPGGGR